MEYISGLTSAGKEWVPTFVKSSNVENCISCAKCYKVCGRGVFEPVESADDGMCGAKMMAVMHPEECIGCGACARSCPRKNIVCEPKHKGS